MLSGFHIFFEKNAPYIFILKARNILRERKERDRDIERDRERQRERRRDI